MCSAKLPVLPGSYSGSEELVDALRKVAKGHMMIPDHTVKRAFRLLRGGNQRIRDPNVLTAREREVLTHFAQGKPYAQIAEALGLSTVTVRNTVYRIQDKLGVHSKQEIVVWAARSGLLLARRLQPGFG